jgi:predicted aldo/keto reductase-like oxidoreductase
MRVFRLRRSLPPLLFAAGIVASWVVFGETMEEALDSCVAGLPIDDVLRHKMYFEDYRSEKEAMRRYAALGELNAAHCIGCPAPCAGACPHGIPIQEKMLAAHARLTLA